MNYFRLNDHLDKPKRYSGATMLDIIIIGSINLIGFLIGKLIFSIVISLIVIRVIKSISQSPKLNHWKRWAYSQVVELKVGPNKSKRFFL